jgi:hypothetical protein
MADDKPPSRLALVLTAALFAVLGILMILHGAGVVDASWFNPNPHTPGWVFSAVGAFLLLGGLLLVNQLVPLRPQTVNAAGWSAIAIGMVIANWLVFFAEGASCGVASGGLAFGGLGLLCRGLAGLVLLFFDVVLLAVALPWAWGKIRR